MKKDNKIIKLSIMSKQATGGGIGILGILGIVFIVLKLVGTIDWSWWYVTMPFWGAIAVPLAITIIFFVGAILIGGFVNFIVWFINLFRKK